MAFVKGHCRAIPQIRHIPRHIGRRTATNVKNIPRTERGCAIAPQQRNGDIRLRRIRCRRIGLLYDRCYRARASHIEHMAIRQRQCAGLSEISDIAACHGRACSGTNACNVSHIQLQLAAATKQCDSDLIRTDDILLCHGRGRSSPHQVQHLPTDKL